MEEHQDFYKKHLGISKSQLYDILGKLAILAVFAWLAWWVVIQPVIGRFWGVPEIGHLFEKNRPYDTRYYVNLFPEDADSKNYRLVGGITVYDGDCYDTGDGTECEQGTISLNSVSWPNGGSSYFDDCALEKEKVLCIDNEERFWQVESTDERVK